LWVAFWLGYGVLYGSASDSRWDKGGHGTAFRMCWMNDAVHQIACLMMMRAPHDSRWSHARHHTDTFTRRELPPTARPCREDLDVAALGGRVVAAE
jgi:fatty acid desaturase